MEAKETVYGIYKKDPLIRDDGHCTTMFIYFYGDKKDCTEGLSSKAKYASVLSFYDGKTDTKGFYKESKIIYVDLRRRFKMEEMKATKKECFEIVQTIQDKETKEVFIELKYKYYPDDVEKTKRFFKEFMKLCSETDEMFVESTIKGILAENENKVHLTKEL